MSARPPSANPGACSPAQRFKQCPPQGLPAADCAHKTAGREALLADGRDRVVVMWEVPRHARRPYAGVSRIRFQGCNLSQPVEWAGTPGEQR